MITSYMKKAFIECLNGNEDYRIEAIKHHSYLKGISPKYIETPLGLAMDQFVINPISPYMSTLRDQAMEAISRMS